MPRYTEKTKERARSLHREGNSIRAISRTFGINFSTVRSWIVPPNARERVRARKYAAPYRRKFQRIDELYLGIVSVCPKCKARGYVTIRRVRNWKSAHSCYVWIVSHWKSSVHRLAFRLWDGEGIVFTSPIREQEFRELVSPDVQGAA